MNRHNPSPYAANLAWLDSQQPVLEALTLAWTRIRSSSYDTQGLAHLAEAVRDEFLVLNPDSVEEISLSPHEVIDASGSRVPKPLGKALRFRKRSEAPVQVFLCIHMDVVYGSSLGEVVIDRIGKDRMRGSGLCDAKGGMAILLKAVEALERSPFASGVGWEILLTPDEEIGSPGSLPLLHEAARIYHAGLLYEPSLPDGSLVGKRKGSGNFSVVVRGRSAHAGRNIQDGRNAIIALCELLLRLEKCNEPEAGISLNVGRVEGGGPVNRVPDLAIGRFNLRVEEPAQQEEVLDRIKAMVLESGKREGITVELDGAFSSPPKPFQDGTLELAQQVVACGLDLGLELRFESSGGVCDGNKLAAAGLPNIDTLGARGGALHSPDEYIFLDSLAERAKLSALLLMKWGAGEIRPPQKM